MANFFFLLLVILQGFKIFEAIPIYVAALPIMFIVAVTALKDGIEDYRRWKADKSVNHRTTLTLDGPGYRNYNYPDKLRLKLFDKMWKPVKK